METRFTSKHLTLTPAIESYAQKKIEKFARFYDHIREVDTVIDREKSGYMVEIIVHVDHHAPFVARSEHEDLYACIDLGIDRAVRQLKDHKSRQRDNKHHPSVRGTDA